MTPLSTVSYCLSCFYMLVGQRWSEQTHANGPSRGRGGSRGGFRRGGAPPQGSPRQQREPEDDNENDDGQRGYSEDVSREMGNLSISSHPQSSSSDYQRRPSSEYSQSRFSCSPLKC